MDKAVPKYNEKLNNEHFFERVDDCRTSYNHRKKEPMRHDIGKIMRSTLSEMENILPLYGLQKRVPEIHAFPENQFWKYLLKLGEEGLRSLACSVF